MSIRLVAEVLKFSPSYLSSAERMILIVIAEQCRGESRVCYPGIEIMMRYTGLTRNGLKAAFRRLEDHGMEVRVEHGKDSNGRPIYAAKGRRTTYRLPDLEGIAEDAEPPPAGPPNGDATVTPMTPAYGDATVTPSDQPMGPLSEQGGHSMGPLSALYGDATVTPFPYKHPYKQNQPTNTRSAPPIEEIVDAELVDVDLFGNPVEDPQPSPVPALVAAYVDALRADGGVATQSMIGAIGKNAKRLIEVDKLHPAVVMIAIQRAAAQRSRTLDRFLGTAQATFDRGGQARRDLFASWQKMHDQAIGEENKQIGNS